MLKVLAQAEVLILGSDQGFIKKDLLVYLGHQVHLKARSVLFWIICLACMFAVETDATAPHANLEPSDRKKLQNQSFENSTHFALTFLEICRIQSPWPGSAAASWTRTGSESSLTANTLLQSLNPLKKKKKALRFSRSA